MRSSLAAVLVFAAAWLAPGSARAQADAHCAAPGRAGRVTRELLERPIELTDAAGTLRQKVSTDSAEAQAYYDQGFANLASYVWVDAARSFHEALRRDPNLAMAHLGLAKALTGAEAKDDAKERLRLADEAAKANPPTEKEKRWIALGLQQRAALDAPEKKRAALHADYKRAIDELIKLDPDDAHAWTMRGNAEESGADGRGQGGGVGSIAYYEAALQHDPNHFGAHHFLVHSYENIGRHEEAAEHGRIYAQAAPGVPHASHMYGHVLPRLGKWDQAMAQFKKSDRLHREYFAALGIDPAEDWHYQHNLHLLGAVSLRLGREAEGEKLLREAHEVEPRGDYGQFYAAPWIEYLLLKGRFEQALGAAAELERRPSAMARAFGAALSGEALLGLGRREEAARALKRAKKAGRELAKENRRRGAGGGMASRAQPLERMLEAELELGGRKPERGRKAMLALADEIAGRPQIDSWASGLFRIERLAAAAKRAGNTELAGELGERMKKIDSEYQPRAVAAAESHRD